MFAFGTGEWVGAGITALLIVLTVVLFVATSRDIDLTVFAVIAFFVTLGVGIGTFVSAYERRQALDVTSDLSAQGFDVMSVDAGGDTATVRRGQCIFERDFRLDGEQYVVVLDHRVLTPSDLTCDSAR